VSKLTLMWTSDNDDLLINFLKWFCLDSEQFLKEGDAYNTALGNSHNDDFEEEIEAVLTVLENDSEVNLQSTSTELNIGMERDAPLALTVDESSDALMTTGDDVSSFQCMFCLFWLYGYIFFNFDGVAYKIVWQPGYRLSRFPNPPSFPHSILRGIYILGPRSFPRGRRDAFVIFLVSPGLSSRPENAMEFPIMSPAPESAPPSTRPWLWVLCVTDIIPLRLVMNLYSVWQQITELFTNSTQDGNRLFNTITIKH